MRVRAGLIALSCALSFNAIAGMMGRHVVNEYRPWSVIGSLGYTWYDNAYEGGPTADPVAQTAIGDGQTVLGRFAIARDLFPIQTTHIGIEVGVQNGNIMRLDIPQATLNELGGTPIQTTIKPMLDLLGTVTFPLTRRVPLDGIVKCGVAYRRLQVIDRVTFNDISEAAFEVQAGLGMKISDRANLSLSYQGVFDGSARYTVISPVLDTGHISNIPLQNGLLLSLSYTV